MSFYLIAQIVLGGLSPLLWLIKDEKLFRLIGAAIPFSWSALNFYAGLYDSSLILFAIGCRALTGLYLMDKGVRPKTYAAIFFVAFFSYMLFKGYRDIYSWLPWFAACGTTLAQLFLTGIALRLTQSIGSDGAWVFYDAVNAVWGHLFEKSVGIVLNFWTVRQMHLAQKKANGCEGTCGSIEK